jgi:hypothetical protein
LEHPDADLIDSRRTTIASHGSPGFEHQLGSNPSRQTMDFDLSFGHDYLLADPVDRWVERFLMPSVGGRFLAAAGFLKEEQADLRRSQSPG